MGTSTTEKLAVGEKQNQLSSARKGLEEQDIHSLVQRGLSFKRLLFPGFKSPSRSSRVVAIEFDFCP